MGNRAAIAARHGVKVNTAALAAAKRGTNHPEGFLNIGDMSELKKLQISAGFLNVF